MEAAPSRRSFVRLTAVKLHGYLKEQLQVKFGHSTTVRWLPRVGGSQPAALRVPQPWPKARRQHARRASRAERQVLGDDP